MLVSLITLSACVTAAFAAQATTTHYDDGTLGACGCGTALDSYIYTAAGSQALFGSGTWCGSGCGVCYSLTSTGTAPAGEGTGGGAGTSIMVVITNLCPYSGNENWCPSSGNNAYGYSAHFDINSLSGNGQFNSLGWNNPIVNYQQIACPSNVNSAFASSCECKSGGGTAPSMTTTTTTPPHTTTTTSTTSHTTTTAASSGGGSGTAAHYGQCGGTGWTGPTTCASPYKCTYSSAYYSQCL